MVNYMQHYQDVQIQIHYLLKTIQKILMKLIMLIGKKLSIVNNFRKNVLFFIINHYFISG